MDTVQLALCVVVIVMVVVVMHGAVCIHTYVWRRVYVCIYIQYVYMQC